MFVETGSLLSVGHGTSFPFVSVVRPGMNISTNTEASERRVNTCRALSLSSELVSIPTGMPINGQFTARRRNGSMWVG